MCWGRGGGGGEGELRCWCRSGDFVYKLDKDHHVSNEKEKLFIVLVCTKCIIQANIRKTKKTQDDISEYQKTTKFKDG